MAARQGNSPFHAEVVVPAGIVQGTATPIPAKSSPALILAAGDGISGIILPPAGKGKTFAVQNNSLTQIGVLNVYPASGDQINQLGANVAYTLPSQTGTVFYAGPGRQWYTIPVVPS